MTLSSLSPANPRKFQDPFFTVKGERRARVVLKALETLWFNTGTLCNLTCRHCYIESSPKNDRLVYLTAAEVTEYLDQIEAGGLSTSLIGFTGGEPFMNPELTAMLEDVLSRGLAALVLTNAMKPMAKCKLALLRLRDRYGDRLTIRVSIDHYGRHAHELERGSRSWAPTIDGLLWLSRNGFSPHVASRRLSEESGHPWEIAGERHVRDLSDGRQTQRCCTPCGGRLHSLTLRPALRARPHSGRRGRCGAA